MLPPQLVTRERTMDDTIRPTESAARFIAAMGLAATGVSVVTTNGRAGRFGLTVSSVSSVSAAPPLVLACVNRKSPAAAAIGENQLFAVNLLAAHNRDYAETFAGRPQAGKPYDFSAHNWRTGDTGVPLSAMRPRSSNASSNRATMPALIASSSDGS
jgi:flavin reductase (DIM6/NTAB) family NADH-FMN oxidoreductase RutF